MVGDLKRYGTVWFYASGIANILSLHRVAERFSVTYDSQESNCLLYGNMMGQHDALFLVHADFITVT